MSPVSRLRLGTPQFPCLLLIQSLVLILWQTTSLSSGQAQVSEELAAPGFQDFVKAEGLRLRTDDRDPQTNEEWKQRREQLRENLRRAWGGLSHERCDLNPQYLGTIERDGYRIEKILIQTMPDVWMTANLWIPTSLGPSTGNVVPKRPAVLCVHGHWKGAKQDPVVQSRCIGLVKLGFVVMCVDAFGAGERAIGEELGEYHGEMTGAMLLPLGLPLSGIQVYENMRAVDYLISRDDVAPDRIGITGASGGGNQSMYAGAYDERFRCVVPTCSVGTYQSYLSAACCMCEVVPGALRFTEEGDVLGLAAGRGLMVTSATQDAFQFSVDQARVSIARARQISKLIDGTEVRHTIIESPHHYNQPMREAMYGWMTLHLKGEGTGEPIAEPEIAPEDPETIRCYPGTSRPDDYVTLPRFAARKAQQLFESQITPRRTTMIEQASASAAEQTVVRINKERLQTLLGNPPQKNRWSPGSATVSNHTNPVAGRSEFLQITIRQDGEIPVQAYLDRNQQTSGVNPDQKQRPLAVLIALDQPAIEVFNGPEADDLRTRGHRVMVADLSATGRQAVAGDTIGNAIDHNSAEWSLWLGRPLIGRWCFELQSCLHAVHEVEQQLPEEIHLQGEGSAAFVALVTAAVDDRFSHVLVRNLPVTFASEVPYRGIRLGILIPGLLPEIGDVADVAALICPRQLTITGGKSPGGTELSGEQIDASLGWVQQYYGAAGHADRCRISDHR